MKKNQFLIFIVLIIFFSTFNNVFSNEILVAAASNFNLALDRLIIQYKTQSDDKIIVSYSSTGKHYAQIKNGAPFDIFFAADTLRPFLLEQEGKAIPGSRFTYAVGKIILWSPDINLIDKKGSILQNGNFHYLAIANPVLAPYGKAAMEVLDNLGLRKKYTDRLVRGENINQAFQYIVSANADLGFVALSQVMQDGKRIIGSYMEIDSTLYTPIFQQLVLLKENKSAAAFIEFIKSEKARLIIKKFGYTLNGNK